MIHMRNINRAKQRALMVFATTALLVGGVAAPSFATTDPSDPLNGSGDSFFSTLQGYLTTHLVPLVIGLAVVGVAITMLVKWGKKAAKSA